MSQAVDALPDAPGQPKGVAQVPFPHTKDSPYVGVWLEHAHTDREPEMVVGDKRYQAPKTVIPIDSLVATQDFVLRSTLKDLADAPPGKLKPPLVLKKGGKFYLDEGTHRATLAKLRGQKNILVHLFDADALDTPDATFADFPSPDGWDEYAASVSYTGEKRTPSGQIIRYQDGKRV